MYNKVRYRLNPKGGGVKGENIWEPFIKNVNNVKIIGILKHWPTESIYNFKYFYNQSFWV